MKKDKLGGGQVDAPHQDRFQALGFRMHGKDNKKQVGDASDKHTSIISLLEEGGMRSGHGALPFVQPQR